MFTRNKHTMVSPNSMVNLSQLLSITGSMMRHTVQDRPVILKGASNERDTNEIEASVARAGEGGWESGSPKSRLGL